ncbi:JmjC domain, hydroxylase-domain-containing protein [Mycena sp. CBHHK59/15]|nr:JmjC domain, hydroxylase-domain-containing protein [Mycena sp. CBHHK59/15]
MIRAWIDEKTSQFCALMSSPVSSLTPSRSPSPEPPIQPDHFYGADPSHLPPSPDSDGKAYLSPDDDPLAHRGIPVFKPTMHEFRDFEAYMNRVECWGRKSGIVKVVPPKEWTDALPDVKPQLAAVKIKSPIEQFMRGRAGLFRQENMEKRKLMSVREWVELCAKDEFRAPGVEEVGLHHHPGAQPALRSKRKKAPVKDEVKDEPVDEVSMASPPNSVTPDPEDTKPRNRRVERADKDASFISAFDPHTDWLPPGTTSAEYTPEFCSKLERAFWRNCGLGKPAWYGADTMGSLYTDSTTAWNVAHLTSTLSRLLPATAQGLPGVNTPYLYFGMWRATFAWHVEDMDLFSINYIHFGAPKFWYAVPQARAGALEDTMRGYFPKDTSSCPQFLRHKSFLASPTLLAQSAVRPNHLVQHAGEFVITFPRGYHAGFNLGLNCAESVNFALDSWVEEGRRAGVCKCVDDSVRIDVDQLIEDRRIEALEKTDPAAAALARAAQAEGREEEKAAVDPTKDQGPLPTVILPPAKPRSPRKRRPTTKLEADSAKRPRTVSAPSAAASTSASASTYYTHNYHTHTHRSGNGGGSNTAPPAGAQKLTLKLGPRPEEETFPCCLCIDASAESLVRVHDLPTAWREVGPAARVHFPAIAGGKGVWMAHEACAIVLPETWVDEVDVPGHGRERVVFGVDGIVRGRWSLKCSSCTRARPKNHGALIQCTKGKCPKSFHISCAKKGGAAGIAYSVLREVEKEVVLLEPAFPTPHGVPSTTPQVEPTARVLKVIKKVEVEALCPQHNPVIVAERRASKQDQLRADMLALQPLARIKIRVSAGVFEVTLIRVLEEKRSVEVLWDLGEIREFKWGSIILGTTNLPTVQLPIASTGSAPTTTNPPQSIAPYTPYRAQYSGGLASSSAAPRFPSNVNIMNPTLTTTTPVAGVNPGAYRMYQYDYWPQAGQAQYNSKSNASAPPTDTPATHAPNPYSYFPGGTHYANSYYTGPQAQQWSQQYYRAGQCYNQSQQAQAPRQQPAIAASISIPHTEGGTQYPTAPPTASPTSRVPNPATSAPSPIPAPASDPMPVDVQV